MFLKTTVSTPLSVIIFTGSPFPHPTFTGARGAHKMYHGNNYSYHRVHNSYQAIQKTMIRNYSNIFTCHPFQPSPIPLLRVVLFRSVLLLMLQNYKRIVLISHRLATFRSQFQWTRIFISLTTPMAKGTDLNGIESHYCHCSQKL